MVVFSSQPSDSTYSQVYSPVTSEQPSASNFNLPPDAVFLAMLLSLAFGLFCCRKHRKQHLSIEQQRAMLERMWQLSSTK
jgi:hypothetical protein